MTKKLTKAEKAAQKKLHHRSMAGTHAHRAKRLGTAMPGEAKKAGKQALSHARKARGDTLTPAQKKKK
jgi:hypothetical protein